MRTYVERDVDKNGLNSTSTDQLRALKRGMGKKNLETLKRVWGRRGTQNIEKQKIFKYKFALNLSLCKRQRSSKRGRWEFRGEDIMQIH